MVDPATFRDVLAQWPSGVTVVTTLVGLASLARHDRELVLERQPRPRRWSPSAWIARLYTPRAGLRERRLRHQRARQGPGRGGPPLRRHGAGLSRTGSPARRGRPPRPGCRCSTPPSAGSTAGSCTSTPAATTPSSSARCSRATPPAVRRRCSSTPGAGASSPTCCPTSPRSSDGGLVPTSRPGRLRPADRRGPVEPSARPGSGSGPRPDRRRRAAFPEALASPRRAHARWSAPPAQPRGASSRGVDVVEVVVDPADPVAVERAVAALAATAGRVVGRSSRTPSPRARRARCSPRSRRSPPPRCRRDLPADRLGAGDAAGGAGPAAGGRRAGPSGAAPGGPARPRPARPGQGDHRAQERRPHFDTTLDRPWTARSPPRTWSGCSATSRSDSPADAPVATSRRRLRDARAHRLPRDPATGATDHAAAPARQRRRSRRMTAR